MSLTNKKFDLNSEYHPNNFLFQVSQIFNENIERVWNFIRDLSYNQKIVQEFPMKLKYIKGNNTYRIGNICSIHIQGFIKMFIECMKLKFQNMKKEIVWNISSDINISYKSTYYFYKVSAENKTLVKIIISKIPHILQNEITIGSSKSYYKEVYKNKLINFDKYISKSDKNMSNYESCIINSYFKDIWKIITNFVIFGEISPLIGTDIKCFGDHLKVGSFWKCKNGGIVIYYKVIKVEMSNKRNCWSYYLETIGTNELIEKQELRFKVTKINNSKTFFSIEQIFKQYINTDRIKIKNNNIKEIFEKLKQYFENIKFNKINNDKNNNYFMNCKNINNITNISNNNNVTSSNTDDLNNYSYYNRESMIEVNCRSEVEMNNTKNNSV